IAELSPTLLSQVPTADSLYLAAIADFNTRDYRRCLKRLDDHREWLHEGSLPMDIRRLRVACLESLGRPREALAEAAGLRKNDASIETSVSYVRLALKFGHINGALEVGRELAERQDTTIRDRISIAELLAPHDPRLSRHLLA